MSEKSKSVTVKTAGALALPNGATIRQLIEDNMDGQLEASSLDRVKIPPAGIVSWAIPTMDGEESVKAIEGILIYKQLQNVYWSTPMTEGAGNPPDCAAKDAVHGVGTPGGDCLSCPYNQFGSDAKGKGKACKNIQVVYILQPGKILPTAIFLPPTSIPVLKKYLAMITSAGVPFYGVVSRFTLEKTKNGDGIEYSKVAVAVKQLNPDGTTDVERVKIPETQLAQIGEYRAAIIPALQAVEIVSTDYYDATEGTDAEA